MNIRDKRQTILELVTAVSEIIVLIVEGIQKLKEQKEEVELQKQLTNEQ